MTQPLADIIRQVETQYADARRAAGTLGDDPMTYHRRYDAEMRLLCARLFTQFGARFNTKADASRFVLAGISASSTQGIGQAIGNWLTAARKRVPA